MLAHTKSHTKSHTQTHTHLEVHLLHIEYHYTEHAVCLKSLDDINSVSNHQKVMLVSDFGLEHFPPGPVTTPAERAK